MDTTTTDNSPANGLDSLKQRYFAGSQKHRTRAILIMTFAVVFCSRLVYILSLPAIIFSTTQNPVDITIEQIENGEMPYQLNWNLNGFRPAIDACIPAFWERRDNDNLEHRGFYLPLASDQQQADDVARRPVVVLEAGLDFIEKRNLTPMNQASSKIVELASLGQLSGHRSINPTPISPLELEKLQEFYPGYSAQDFVVFSADDSPEKSLLTLAGSGIGIIALFFIMWGLAAIGHWRKYRKETKFESKLDSLIVCQHYNCKSTLEFINQQTDALGEKFIEPFDLTSPDVEAKLNPFVCLSLFMISLVAFPAICFGIVCYVDTVLKAVAAGLAFLLIYRNFRRIWAYLNRREPEELEVWFPRRKLPVADSAFYRHHSKVLASLGFTLIGKSATRHFFASPNHRLLAVLGIQRAAKNRLSQNYFSLLSVLEGGEVIQTTSRPENIYTRSLHQPDWFITPADDLSFCQAIEKHREVIHAMQCKDRHKQFAITESNYTSVVDHVDRLYDAAWSSMLENTWFAI